MKKKILLITLALVLCVAITGCGKEKRQRKRY